MPETASDHLFDDSAIVGTGRLLGDWPITAPTLVEVPATDQPTVAPQAEQLPFDSDEMRSAA
ncbi:hypothetical protein AB0O20_06765 [Streptomyces kronopolitis]|uniref:hypothetical protein n=1 Tax=Streptomyces kronopolitis TaxID=1612435 RepID=UPI0034398512